MVLVRSQRFTRTNPLVDCDLRVVIYTPKSPHTMGGGFNYGNSSVGRASVSKTEGRGFESSFPCKI